jgi:hypothetical protein
MGRDSYFSVSIVALAWSEFVAITDKAPVVGLAVETHNRHPKINFASIQLRSLDFVARWQTSATRLCHRGRFSFSP